MELIMKKLVKVEEVEGEGLMAFMGKSIALYGLNYIYSGTLVGVNEQFVKLENAMIVYETGELSAKSWKDAQRLPGDHYVMLSAIESFGPGKE
jgi:hypothetical protein